MQVKEWLEGNDCTEVTPIRVTIGKEQFEGCSYKQGNDQQRLYLLGSLPKVKHPKGRKYPRSNVCFTCNGKDWYVSFYMPKENLKPENERFHPFGLSFGVFHWDAPDPIDKYEKYVRYAMTIENAT